MTDVHLDTDFLVRALGLRGAEWFELLSLAESEAEIRMSAVAWYEFSRGPRTPDQLARAAFFLGEDGIVPFSAELATVAGGVFRALGSPRRRANDIAIGVTAAELGAVLLTHNPSDFHGIPRLEVLAAG